MVIDANTQLIGTGPFNFDVSMAQRLGYTDEEIGSAANAVHVLSIGFGSRLAKRLGYKRICDNCEQWTYANKPCHLCEADNIPKRPKRRNKR